MNKKGQVFVGLIVVLLGILILIFAAPILFSFVSLGVSQTGTASGFVIRLFPFVLFLILLFFGWKLISSGGDVF